MVRVSRLFAHLMTTHRRVRRAFPPSVLASIEQAIRAGEAGHVGEIRFVVEGALDVLPLLQGQSARDRAIELFSQLRVWDTAHNSGVLIYLLLADRQIEIVADRGVDLKVGQAGWQALCHDMEAAFRAGRFADGVLGCIQAVSGLLVQHFPKASAPDSNELPDVPLVL